MLVYPVPIHLSYLFKSSMKFNLAKIYIVTYKPEKLPYFDVKQGVASVDYIKCLLRISFTSAISTFKFYGAFESNYSFNSKGNHVYGEVNGNNLNIKIFSH